MANHTPGPWIVGAFGDVWAGTYFDVETGKWSEVSEGSAKVIASSDPKDPESVANASLIAAAPKMYAALREIAESGHCGCNPCHGHPERDVFIDIARDALAEVEGRQ